MSFPSRRSSALAFFVASLLVGCDSGSNSAASTTAAPTCSDYVCHWAGVDSSEWTSSVEGTALHVYDTLHLELVADSTYLQWHVEAAYNGTTRYGLKPSRISTGTWRVSADSLKLFQGSTPRSVRAVLTPNLLTISLPGNAQPTLFTPR